MSTASRCFLQQYIPDLWSHGSPLLYPECRGKIWTNNTILYNAKIYALETKQLHCKHQPGCQLVLLVETRANPLQCNLYLRKGGKKRDTTNKCDVSLHCTFQLAREQHCKVGYQCFRFKYTLNYRTRSMENKCFSIFSSCLSKEWLPFSFRNNLQWATPYRYQSRRFWKGLRMFIRVMSSRKWGHECWIYLMDFQSGELQAACNSWSSPGVPSTTSLWEAQLGLLGWAGDNPGTCTPEPNWAHTEQPLLWNMAHKHSHFQRKNLKEN